LILKKVAIIGSAGIPARYGGFETLAQNLVYNLSTETHFIVYCSKKLYDKHERLASCDYAELVYLPLKANGPQSVIYDFMSIIHAIRKADVLLILGVSGCLMLPLVRLFSRKKIITNIDGLEWKRSKWNLAARIFLLMSEYLAVRFSDNIISDNESINYYIRKKYKLKPELIEYGGDNTKLMSGEINAGEDVINIKGNYALSVSRIEPENNIHIILDAYSNMPDRKITVVGNWNQNRYGRKLYKLYNHYPNISLYQPIYNQNLLNILRSNCAIYIHGYSAGGTNPALVEAMYSGKPVIVYDVPYNKSTTCGKALYFRNSDDLVNIVNKADKSVFERNRKHMKEIADKKYRWNTICAKYAALLL
jgi:glycosyltransferase involved in cell wall biosynthesis